MKTNIKKKFTEKDLMMTDYDNELNFLDLIKLFYKRNGICYPNDLKLDKLSNIIDEKKHTIFILVDALGYNLIDSFDNNSILKINNKAILRGIQPSNKPSSLISLATGEYPSKHGIFGIRNHNAKYNINYNVLTYTNILTNEKLKIQKGEIFKYKSKLNYLDCNVNLYISNNIDNQFISQYLVNKTNINYYNNYLEVSDEITNYSDKTLSILYIDDIDHKERMYGVYSNEVKLEIRKLEKFLSNIKLDNDTNIVLASNYAVTDITNYIKFDIDKYNKYFYATPTIGESTISYYIKPNMEEEFIKEFKSDFRSKMFLLTKDDFIKYNVFGPKMHKYACSNLGEYISITKKGGSISPNSVKASSSGFSSDESLVPLIVIDK